MKNINGPIAIKNICYTSGCYLRYMLMVMSLFSLSTWEMPRMYPFTDTETTEYTELQPLLSGVHSIMRVNLAQAAEGGRCTPTPFYYIYHHQ